MKKSLLPLAALASLAFLSATSFAANDLSYNYVELDYIVRDIDLYEDDDEFENFFDDRDDGDGYQLEGSFSFMERFFVFGNYSNAEAEFTFTTDEGVEVPQGADVKVMNLGLGYFTPIAYNTDFVARVAYRDIDYGGFNLGENPTDIDDFGDIDEALEDLREDSSAGAAIDVGVRSQVADWVEAGGGLRYTNLDTGDDFSLFGNVLFEITPNMGVNVAVDLGDMMTVYRLGFRYSVM